LPPPDEAHRPAADIFVDLPERVGGGDPRRHHEARPGGVTERQQHFRIRLLKAQRSVRSSIATSSLGVARLSFA